jgi:DNA-binding response OmpR family regulator
VAADAAAARSVLEVETPDPIVLDVMLPGEDGETAR